MADDSPAADLAGKDPWLLAAMAILAFLILDWASNIVYALLAERTYVGTVRGRLSSLFGADEAVEATCILAIVFLVVLFSERSQADNSKLIGILLLGATVLGAAAVVGALVNTLIELSWLGSGFGRHLSSAVDTVGDALINGGAAFWAYKEWQARGAPTLG